MQSLGLAIFVLLLVLGVAGWCVGYFFYRRLRTHHPDTWTDLGSPTLLYNASAKNQMAVMHFLWRAHHKKLADYRLDRLALALRILGGVGMALFLLAVVLSIITRSPI